MVIFPPARITQSNGKNMKTLFTTITILTIGGFCVGCNKRKAVSYTRFFNTHDGKAHIESVARIKGLEAGSSGSSHSLGGSAGKKDFEISFKGSNSARDAIMRDYKDFVEKELSGSGVTINGRGVSGEVSGFYFDYHGAGE